VENRSPIRRRLSFVAPAMLMAALGLLVPHAQAALLLAQDCDASRNTLDCHLAGVLSFLYIAAGLLAVVLLLVVVLAVRSYRRKNDDRKGPR
jgi:H+/Cl- antiporter ClcA